MRKDGLSGFLNADLINKYFTSKGRKLIADNISFIFVIFRARVAKLVDALPSGGSVRKDVLVRVQSRAL